MTGNRRRMGDIALAKYAIWRPFFWIYLSFGGENYFLYCLVANNQTAQTVFIYTYVRVQLIACLSRLSNLCQKGQICYFKE